ncbi:MAG: alpha/beta hydrolase-fold protein [Desulfomonilaceae bacterium]|nr:alpha/beta hydrolase-fold protein [Desulfomonilaceae bacterium]
MWPIVRTGIVVRILGCVLMPALMLGACGTQQTGSPEVEAPSKSVTGARGPMQLPAEDVGPTRRIHPPKSPSQQESTSSPEISVRSDVIASLPPPVADAGPTVRTISGYRVPAEYFVVPSANVPEAVAVVTLPKDYDRKPHKKYPLVIAFGGAGECSRPPHRGAMAWMHYYKSDEAIEALEDNRLEKADFRGLVRSAHLDEFNERLKRNPYEGIILVCPSSPPLSYAEGGESPQYESYIMHDLIPALKRHYRVAPGRLGVDGVSMGGSRSMYYGLKYPDVFSSIGAIQGALGPYMNMYKNLIARNRDMLKECSIQLVTSDGDYLASSVKKMRRFLLEEKIPHTYRMLTGPHDYVFNQGPGSIALLVFHNEVLNAKRSGPVR